MFRFQMLTALELGTPEWTAIAQPCAVADDAYEPEHICASWSVSRKGHGGH